jgi:predicted permease
VGAAVGRTLLPEDDREGAPLVAMVSHRMWVRDFQRDAGILSTGLRIQGRTFQVVGVMPEGFFGLNPIEPHDVMLPHAAAQLVIAGRDGLPRVGCVTFGRLAQGTTPEQARAESEVLFRQASLPANAPARDTLRVLVSAVQPGAEPFGLRAQTGPSLSLLIAASALLLLIVCINLGGLLLVRAGARAREIGTLLALGATRLRVARHLLAESLILSAAGGAAGVALAYAASPAVPRLLQPLLTSTTLTGEGRPLGVDVSPDSRVLAFAAIVVVLTVIAFGVMPAIRGSRVDVLSMLKQGSITATRRAWRGTGGGALLAAQVALSFVLLAGAGLMARTVDNLQAVDVGYEPDRVVFATIHPAGRPRAFVEDALRRLERLPGVTAVSASQWPIFNNAEPKPPFCIAGRDPSAHAADLEMVLPRFFETWGVALLQGTDFVSSGMDAAIVNSAFVSRFFRGRSAVGQTIGIGGCPGRPLTIVGVVADHLDRQREAVTPMVYVPYPTGLASTPTTLAARTTGDARALVPDFRAVISQLDTTLTEGDVTTGTAYRARTIRREALLTALLAMFGAMATFASCLGTYALVASTLTRRTRELGLRVALGARRIDVVLTIARPYGAVMAAGLAAGTLATIGASVWIESFLFRVSRIDPWTIAAAAALLVLAAALAAAGPARRALGISPAESMRCD